MRNILLAACLVLAMLALGAYLISRQGFSARPEGSAAEAWLAGQARAWSLPAAYREMRNPVECSTAALAEARAHWADHCAGCHANNGSGDSMLGLMLIIQLLDMRLPATQGQPDGGLYFTIKNGVRFTGMPAFGEPGDRDSETWKLVCFVRHLPRIASEEVGK